MFMVRFAPIFEVPFLFLFALGRFFLRCERFFFVSGDLRQGAFDALKAVPWRVKIRAFVRWMLPVRIRMHCSSSCCLLVFFSDEAMVECLNFRSRLWHRSNVFSTVFYQEMSLGPPPCSKVLSLLLLCLANLSFLEFGLSFTQLQNWIVMLFLW